MNGVERYSKERGKGRQRKRKSLEVSTLTSTPHIGGGGLGADGR